MKKYPESYDVVVIGCGPGGAAAGKFAAKNGAKTLIIDKKREPGVPVYDSASVIYGLYELENACDLRFNRSKVCDYALHGNTFISPSGNYGGYQPWLDGYRINRREFEIALAKSAGRAGAEIMMDTRFIDFVRDGAGKITGIIAERGADRWEIDCKIVIGAEGTPSQVNRLTSLKTPGTVVVSLGREYVGVKRLVDMEKPLYETHMVPALAGFFCWLAPMGPDHYGIGIAYNPTLIKDRNPREIHKAFIENLEKNGRYDFSNAAEVKMYAGMTTTVKESAPVLEEDGFMMVGDAAWRPLIGCQWGSPGMPTAVWTGRFAGISAAEAIRKGDVSAKQLHAYTEMVDGTFKDPKKDKAAINEAREWYFKLMNATPEMQDKIIGEIGNLYSSLHLYLRGAMPLADCVPQIAEWWAKQK